VTKRTAGRGPTSAIVADRRENSRVDVCVGLAFDLPLDYRRERERERERERRQREQKKIDDSVGHFIGSNPDAM